VIRKQQGSTAELDALTTTSRVPGASIIAVPAPLPMMVFMIRLLEITLVVPVA
jgi:hypothetical protein